MITRRSAFVATVAVGGLLTAAPVAAQFGVGINLGSNGFGVEARQTLSPSFDLRFGIAGLRYNLDYEYDDVDYDVEQSLAVPEVILDWRPMRGMFRMSLGAAYYNDVQKLQAVPFVAGLYEIGNGAYLGNEIGVLNGKVSWHTGMPYLGVGWDFLRGGKGPEFSVDVGAYYRGKPDVSLTASNAGVTPGLAGDLAVETQKIESDAWTFIPAVKLGMLFRF